MSRSQYDENLVENAFFSTLLRTKEFLDHVIANKMTVCVPCAGSYNKRHVITLHDIQSHTISRIGDSGDQFHTHNGKSLIAVSAGFQTCTGFPEEKLANVLFEETFFVDEARYINVICIDSRFDSTTLPLYAYLSCSTLAEASALLFQENPAHLRAKLDRVVQRCIVAHRSTAMAIAQLHTNARKAYSKCLQIVEKEFTFSRRVLCNPNFQMFLELSVELYVTTSLHQTIFSELCYIFGDRDAALNRTLRSLSTLKPTQIEDLNPAFFSSLPTAQARLARLNDESNPREKVRLLCESLTVLPNASQTGQPMSMDHLLPLLNYLVIKSEIPNWLANLHYMQKFALCSHSSDDRHGFTLVCFEAALEHIR